MSGVLCFSISNHFTIFYNNFVLFLSKYSNFIYFICFCCLFHMPLYRFVASTQTLMMKCSRKFTYSSSFSTFHRLLLCLFRICCNLICCYYHYISISSSTAISFAPPLYFITYWMSVFIVVVIMVFWWQTFGQKVTHVLCRYGRMVVLVS